MLVFSSLAFIDPANRTGLFEALFVLGALVGVIQILIVLLKLGDLTRYISESVIIGFMLAAAILLAVGQIANALGMKNKGTGDMPVLEQLWVTRYHGDPVNYRAVVLTVITVVLAIVLRAGVKRYGLPQTIAHQSRQDINYNRQILSEGLANLTGGFFQSLPGSGSLSRSAINFQAGALTRFSGIVSAATVAVALLLFAPLMHYVPQPALAGLLLVTAVRLVDFRRPVTTVKASRYDAGLVIITALVGAAVDLDKAVLLGVALSFLLLCPAQRSSKRPS